MMAEARGKRRTFANARELEDALRCIGLSARQAKKCVAGGWAAMGGSEEEEQPEVNDQHVMSRRTASRLVSEIKSAFKGQ